MLYSGSVRTIYIAGMRVGVVWTPCVTFHYRLTSKIGPSSVTVVVVVVVVAVITYQLSTFKHFSIFCDVVRNETT